MKKRFRHFTFWLMAFVFAVAVIAVYKTFDNFDLIWKFFANIMGILSPFVIGFGLAFLLYGPSHFLEKQFRKRKIPIITKHARGTSILLVYIALAGIVALILTFAIPALIRGITDFVNMLIRDLPPLYNQAMEWIAEHSSAGGILDGFDVEGKLQEIYNYVLSNVTADKVIQSLGSVISFTSSLLNIFMAVIRSVYMLASREHLLRALKAVLGLVRLSLQPVPGRLPGGRAGRHRPVGSAGPQRGAAGYARGDDEHDSLFRRHHCRCFLRSD